MIVCYTPSDLRGVTYNFQAAANSDCTLLQLPAFSSTTAVATVTNQPSHVRPGRLGVRLRNVHTPTATNGFIRVLNTTQQVDAAWEISATPRLQINADAQNQIRMMMDTDPNVRTITSYDLLEERQFNLLPCSESYHLYDVYRQGTLANPNNSQQFFTASMNASETKASMGVLIIEIPSISAIQLSYTIMSDDVVRFPANSTLSYLHKTPSQWSQEGFASQVAHARGLDGRTSR